MKNLVSLQSKHENKPPPPPRAPQSAPQPPQFMRDGYPSPPAAFRAPGRISALPSPRTRAAAAGGSHHSRPPHMPDSTQHSQSPRITLGTAPAARAGGLGPGGWAAASRACLMVKSLSTNHSFSPTAPRPRRARPGVTPGHGRAGRGVEGPKLRFVDKVLALKRNRTPAGVPHVGVTPGRRRSGRLPWGWGRHVGASFDAQKQPGVRCHVHRRGGPCDRWLSPPNYEEGLGRCPSAGVRRRGCWLARNTQVQRLLPGVQKKNRWVCPPDLSKVWR